MNDIRSGAYFFDLDPDCFQPIIDQLRGEPVSLAEMSSDGKMELDQLLSLFNLGHRAALQPINTFPIKVIQYLKSNDENKMLLPAWDHIQSKLKVVTSAASELEIYFSELQNEETLSRQHEEKVIEFAERQRNMVKLDVGGQIFCTTRETLMSFPDSYFYGMLNSGQFLPDGEGSFLVICSTEITYHAHALGSYFIGKDPTYFPVILKFLRTKMFSADDFEDSELKKLEILTTYLLLPMSVSRKMSTWNPFECKGCLSLEPNDFSVVRDVWNGTREASAAFGAEKVNRFTVQLDKTLGSYLIMYVGLIPVEDFKLTKNNPRSVLEKGWAVCFFDSGSNLFVNPRLSWNSRCHPFVPECKLSFVYRASRNEIVFKVKSASDQLLLEGGFQDVPPKPYLPFIVCDISKVERIAVAGEALEIVRFC